MKLSCNDEQTGRVPARKPPTQLTWTPPPVCTLRHYADSVRKRRGGGRQACRKKYLSWSRSEADAVGRTRVSVLLGRGLVSLQGHWCTARILRSVTRWPRSGEGQPEQTCLGRRNSVGMFVVVTRSRVSVLLGPGSRSARAPESHPCLDTRGPRQSQIRSVTAAASELLNQGQSLTGSPAGSESEAGYCPAAPGAYARSRGAPAPAAPSAAATSARARGMHTQLQRRPQARGVPSRRACRRDSTVELCELWWDYPAPSPATTPRASRHAVLRPRTSLPCNFGSLFQLEFVPGKFVGPLELQSSGQLQTMTRLLPLAIAAALCVCRAAAWAPLQVL